MKKQITQHQEVGEIIIKKKNCNKKTQQTIIIITF